MGKLVVLDNIRDEFHTHAKYISDVILFLKPLVDRITPEGDVRWIPREIQKERDALLYENLPQLRETYRKLLHFERQTLNVQAELKERCKNEYYQLRNDLIELY